MNATHQTWIHLPAARKGAKCPVSGWSRRKIQQLIYGIPERGIPPKVRYKFIPEQGRGNKGITFVHAPSLMAHLFGEPEIEETDLTTLRILAKSPSFCQSAFTSLINLMNDRAGLTCAEFITYLKSTHHELNPDIRNPHHAPSGPGNNHSLDGKQTVAAA
jgi:hypothetical protein